MAGPEPTWFSHTGAAGDLGGSTRCCSRCSDSCAVGTRRSDPEEIARSHGRRCRRAIGAIVGAAASLLASFLGNAQRARHEQETGRQEARDSAYGNAMRSLLRTGDRGVILAKYTSTEATLTWLDDAIDAQYWLGVLIRVCGKEQRPIITLALEQWSEHISKVGAVRVERSTYRESVERASDAALRIYADISKAAANDAAEDA